jgi:hypothetical protein
VGKFSSRPERVLVEIALNKAHPRHYEELHVLISGISQRNREASRI